MIRTLKYLIILKFTNVKKTMHFLTIKINEVYIKLTLFKEKLTIEFK